MQSVIVIHREWTFSYSGNMHGRGYMYMYVYIAFEYEQACMAVYKEPFCKLLLLRIKKTLLRNTSTTPCIDLQLDRIKEYMNDIYGITMGAPAWVI